jgi:hypothetical protein
VAESCRLQPASDGQRHRPAGLFAARRRTAAGRGPHFNNLDASLFKNFHIHESTALEFRLEAFNATNTPQFGQPNNVTGFNQYKPGNAGGFAAITSTRNDQRQVQAALKLSF